MSYSVQNDFAELHKWLKEKYKLTEPTLSQVAASLVKSSCLTDGLPIRVKTGSPLEIGFASSRADGELHGSLDLTVNFDTPLAIENEE